MNEETVDVNINQVPQSDTGTPSGGSTPAPAAPVQPVYSEPMLPQSKVNEILQARLAEDRAKRAQPPTQGQNQPTQQPLTPEDVSRMIDEKAEFKARQMDATNTIQSFSTKMMAGVDKYPDYEQRVSQLNFAEMANTNPNMIRALNSVDNADEVAYELTKPGNEAKSAMIEFYALTNPARAQQAIATIANSIRHNQESLRQQTAKEPLSHVTPSNASTGNGSGKTSVREERMNPKYRG